MPKSPTARWPDLVFHLGILGVAAYAMVFTLRAVEVIDGTAFFTLFDDAMVSMRYAANLAAGNGLVWNPGEVPVEGYTNLLWTLYMALWHLLPIGQAKLPLAIQLSGLALLLASLFLTRRIADRLAPGRPWVGVAAALLTGTYLPIVFWTMRGMEVPALIFLALIGIERALASLDTQRFDRTLYPILVCGVLIRIDFAVIYVVIAAFLFLTVGGVRVRQLAHSIGWLTAVLAVETVFRVSYYGEWLPNTYYLKVEGVPWAWRVQRGAAVAWNLTRSVFWLAILPPLYLVLHPRDRRLWLPVGLMAACLAYSIHVGGDGWEWWGPAANRYLIPAVPGYAIVAALAVSGLLRRGVRSLEAGPGETVQAAVAALVFVLAFVQVHGGVRGTLFEDWTRVSGMHIADDRSMTRYGIALREITDPSTRIAVYWAGSIPYYSGRPAIDLLGKNDRYIAHQPARIGSFRELHPGHNKWDFGYAIGELRPDIVAHSYDVEAEPYLNEAYDPWLVIDKRIAGEYNPVMYARRDSPRVPRERLAAADWLMEISPDPSLPPSPPVP